MSYISTATIREGGREGGKVRPVVVGQRSRTGNWLPFWFLLPSIVILLALQVGPTLYSFYLSTTSLVQKDGNPVAVNVGLANYIELCASEAFGESLWHTVVYATSFLILTVGVGLMLALLLTRRVKCTTFYLVLIFLPWVISDVVAGTMWRWMFQQTYGIVQVALNPFIGSSLYTDANGAMAIVVPASGWRPLAFPTLIFL